MSSTYRCSTCTKLSHEHPGGDVKGCKRKHLTTDEYITDLKLQRDGLTNHVALLKEGAQASVDKVEYDRLLRVQRVEINGLQNEILGLETQIRDNQSGFNAKVCDMQDEIGRLKCEAKSEKADKETIKLKLQQVRVNYALYENTADPDDWKLVHEGLEAALKEAGAMGMKEDLGALRSAVLHLPTADTSGGGGVGGDDLSWDYTGAFNPAATSTGAFHPAATSTGAFRPAATTTGVFPPTALGLSVPLPPTSTSGVPFPAAASTSVLHPSTAAHGALPLDPASSAARALASPPSDGSVEIDSFSDTSTLCPTPEPSVAISSFKIPNSPHPTPSQRRTPTPTRPPSRPPISSEITQMERDMLNHKDVYAWQRKNFAQLVTIPATIHENLTLPYGPAFTPDPRVARVDFVPIVTHATTPVKAAATITLPMTHPPPVSSRPISHPPPVSPRPSHLRSPHTAPHTAPRTAPHTAPHPAHSAPLSAPLPAPAAPISPPLASAAPISPPLAQVAPISPPLAAATPISPPLAAVTPISPPHAFVDPVSLSMAPSPPVRLRENTPPPDTREPRPPGLYEMDDLEGVRLEHRYDGHICGSNPETHKVAKLLHFVKTEFKASEKIDDYLKHKKELMNCFKSTFPAETLYTLVHIFTT